MTRSSVDPNELLTVAEGAPVLRISKSKLYQLAQDGVIASVRVLGTDKVLFRRRDLLNALKSQSRKTALHGR